MTGRVFVVQRPAKREGPRGDWVDKYDLSSAEAFGELVTLLPYGNLSGDPVKLQAAQDMLEKALADYDGLRDYLLPLGDPVACAMAAAVLGERVQRPISVLKFDRREDAYFAYRIR